MAICTVHKFNVWHPEQGGLPKYEEKEFHFTFPITRTAAREIVERVEGYVIHKEQRPRKGAYIHKPRARKMKG